MLEEYSKNNVEILLKSKNRQTAIDALMYITFNINEPEWIQEKCIELITSGKDKNVRELAVTCLGHVARIHRTINKERTTTLLLKLLKTKELSSQAQDALDDIEHYAE